MECAQKFSTLMRNKVRRFFFEFLFVVVLQVLFDGSDLHVRLLVLVLSPRSCSEVCCFRIPLASLHRIEVSSKSLRLLCDSGMDSHGP